MRCWIPPTTTSEEAPPRVGEARPGPGAGASGSGGAAPAGPKPAGARAPNALVLVPALVPALAFVLAFAFGPFAPAHAATTLKIATVSPDGSSWMKILRAAVQEVDAATEGRVRFKVYPGGVMGDDASVLRRMRVRQLHGGLVTAAVFNRIYHDVQIYNLPMAFRSLDEVDAVREVLDPLLVAGLAKAGFQVFGIAEVGMAYAMSTRPARTAADGRRLKVWTPQGDAAAARTLEAFGITPVPLTIADVLGGLQTGLIDTVAVPPVAAVPLLWHTRLKYVIDLPLMYIYGLFVVSERALRGLDPADRAVVRRIMGEAVAQADRNNRADHAAAWEALRSQGLERIRLTPAEVEDWRALAAAASDRWVQEGVVGREIYAALQERLAAVRAAGGAAASAGGGS